ncbi:MAG: hypothetical protein JWO78_310 [Micavibrio sp.]|nr:hypothetical protein [Micavibrio sp.]
MNKENKLSDTTKREAESAELLPCPFCGKAPEVWENHDQGYSVFGRFWWNVECLDCQISVSDREQFYHDEHGNYVLKYP